jgi:peptidylprolyl isomerase
MPNARVLLTALLACLALFAVACGDDQGDAASTTPAADAAATTEAPATTAGEAAPAAAGGKISKDLEEKPSIAPGEGEPPAELQKQDIVEGKGQTAKEGDNVAVQYVGVNWSNGAEFDASWSRGQAFEFTLGAGNVIPGWDQGVAGMKVGGRRKLVIPPDLGYGPQGTPDGSIPPNETLIFVVDLEKVTRG